MALHAEEGTTEYDAQGRKIGSTGSRAKEFFGPKGYETTAAGLGAKAAEIRRRKAEEAKKAEEEKKAKAQPAKKKTSYRMKLRSALEG